MSDRRLIFKIYKELKCISEHGVLEGAGIGICEDCSLYVHNQCGAILSHFFFLSSGMAAISLISNFHLPVKT